MTPVLRQPITLSPFAADNSPGVVETVAVRAVGMAPAAGVPREQIPATGATTFIASGALRAVWGGVRYALGT